MKWTDAGGRTRGALHPDSQPLTARRGGRSTGRYKDVGAVVEAASWAGLARKVAELKPLVHQGVNGGLPELRRPGAL